MYPDNGLGYAANFLHMMFATPCEAYEVDAHIAKALDVLLIRQKRFAADGVIYEVPAGKLDGEEDPAICAARELEEEAGRRAGRLERLGTLWPSPGFSDERIHLFAAFDLSPVPQRLERDEAIELVPTRLGDALEMIWSGELSDAKSALALLHAARHVGRLS